MNIHLQVLPLAGFKLPPAEKVLEIAENARNERNSIKLMLDTTCNQITDTIDSKPSTPHGSRLLIAFRILCCCFRERRSQTVAAESIVTQKIA